MHLWGAENSNSPKIECWDLTPPLINPYSVWLKEATTAIKILQSLGIYLQEILRILSMLSTYFRFPSAFSRRAVVSYWRKYVHKVLVNRLGGLSLPRKSVVRLTDRLDMTLDVYRGRKTTTQLSMLSLRPGAKTRPEFSPFLKLNYCKFRF